MNCTAIGSAAEEAIMIVWWWLEIRGDGPSQAHVRDRIATNLEGYFMDLRNLCDHRRKTVQSHCIGNLATVQCMMADQLHRRPETDVAILREAL